MSGESSSDGLADWSLVTRDDFENVDKASNSSDDYVKVQEAEGLLRNVREESPNSSAGAEPVRVVPSTQNPPVQLVDSCSGSIDDDLSSTSSSSSDISSNISDLGSKEDRKLEGFEGNESSLATDSDQVRGAVGPVCFQPDSPESLKLQADLEKQSRCLPQLETIAVIQLSKTLDLSSDSDSDFIHLDQSSSSDSSDADDSNPASDEVDEQALPSAPANVPPSMDRSVSSVSSRFSFMAQEPRPEPDVRNESDNEQDERDADTESVGEAEQMDDRIESDQSQSDNAGDVLADDVDWSAVNDIADIPLVAGDVARQYVHRPNRGLNWTLDVVVVLVISVALGLGIGHSIGSMRVRYSRNTAQENNLLILQQKLAQSQTKQEELGQSLNTIKEMIELKDRLISELQSQHNQLREKHLDYEKKKLQLEEERQQLKSQLKFAESTRVVIQNENQELKSRLHDVELKNVKLEQEKSEFQSRVMLAENSKVESIGIIQELKIGSSNQEMNINSKVKENSIVTMQDENDKLRSMLQDVENRNDVLAAENQQLKSQIMISENNIATLQEAVTSQYKQLGECSMLHKKTASLEQENADLRNKLENVARASSQHAKEENEMFDDVPLEDPNDQLEFENENLGDEIVQHRYKKNTATGEWKPLERVTVGSEEDEASKQDSEEVKTSYSSIHDELVKHLAQELEHEQVQAKKWRLLYEAEKKNNSAIDIHSCLNLLSTHLNNSVGKYVNWTSLFSAINNVSHSVVDNVRVIKDSFFSEVQQNYDSVKKTFFEDESGDGSHTEDGKGKTSSDHKHWTDRVSKVLNNTRSSVVNVSKQIHDTWVQVKNLSKSFWKKYEPSFVEVANRLSEKVADMGRRFQEKIRKKTSKWMKRHFSRNEEEENRARFKRKKTSFEKHSDRDDFSSEWDDKMRKESLKDQALMKKAFFKLVDKTARISEKKHRHMSYDDIDEICTLFSRFASWWDIDYWLSEHFRSWFVCQSSWWTDRRDGIKRNLRVCVQFLQDWQQDWEPQMYTQDHYKKYKHCKKTKKCNQKMSSENYNQKHGTKTHDANYHQQQFQPDEDLYYHEKDHHQYNSNDNFRQNGRHHSGNKYHHHEGNPHHHHYYHKSDHRSDGRDTEKSEQKDPIYWQMNGEDSENPNNTFWFDDSEKQDEWYLDWGRNRWKQHKDEHKSDWMFERAAGRKEKRTSISHTSQTTFAKPRSAKFTDEYIDPKTEWLFSRAEERDFYHTMPETWFFERAEYRTKKYFYFDCFDN